jgi:recombination protein RecR
VSSEPLLDQFIEALRCLPGVGPKSAQRMALHLLERDREGGRHLATVLEAAIEQIGRCGQCDRSVLCIVESPSDVMAIEQATGYRGLYFVLMGRLSPLDGIGPAELGLDTLADRLNSEPPAEMIIATNPTVEGEATAYYLQRMAGKHKVAISRIAHGVPLGGELEFTDQSTIAHAFTSRKPIDT